MIISAYQVATTYMKVGLHPECGMKINARLLRPAPVLNKRWYASGCAMFVQGRPKSFTSFPLSIFKSRGARPSKVSQSQSQHRRQLHPTRPLQGRPSGRVRTNHLRGLPFPSLGQGDLAPGFAGSLLLAPLSSCLTLCVSASHHSIASCLLASHPNLTCCPHVNNILSITFA